MKLISAPLDYILMDSLQKSQREQQKGLLVGRLSGQWDFSFNRFLWNSVAEVVSFSRIELWN